MARTLCTLFFGIAIAICFSGAAVADPIDGRDILKFSQRPMADTMISIVPGVVETFNGHDEFSTAYSTFDAAGNIDGYVGNFMADDFADKFATPVVHVKWWGSYLHRPTTHPEPVQTFLISFEEDVPVGPDNPFSHPGDPLLNQIVSLDADGVLTAGEGTYTETIFHPVSVDGPIFEYNAELHLGKEFLQKPNDVKWLKIVALVDVPTDTPADQRIQWGWHNRDYTIPNPLASSPPAVIPGEGPVGIIGVPPVPIWHFQDDAVSGIVNVDIDPNDPMTRIMPDVFQFNFDDQNYLPPFDGPSIIGQFSKDLAFELYTIPEPATLMLVLVAFVGCGFVRPRRSV